MSKELHRAEDFVPETPEYWYRIDTSFSEIYRLSLNKFRVVRKTQCGVWLDVWGREKFCLNDSRKRYAFPTHGEAILSYLKRKEKQINILERQLKLTKEGYFMVGQVYKGKRTLEDVLKPLPGASVFDLQGELS